MNEAAIVADGLDEAIIGKDDKRGRIVYSVEKIINLLMVRDKMTYDDAVEHFSFNIGCAYVGEMTPLYVWTDYEHE